MKREELIYLSLKYHGEYDLIIKAINDKEELKEIKQDNTLTIFDKNYPEEFYSLRKPPLVLYYKGDLNLLKSKKIGVVGSRNACDYALKATADLCKHYNGYAIVSGLAKGIDAKAHLSSDKTIGILGCGINYYYPFENKELIDYMSSNQMVLSEYPDKVKPLGFHFPFRNRLIAALSNTLFVMQSKEKSGTYTTVNEALDIGKEIKVLPFDIYDPDGIGNNKLIKDGAEPILIDELI